MNLQRRILISAFAFLLALSMTAQEKDIRMIYDEAENEYSVGRFEEARDMLKVHLQDFKGSIRESAFRLLSLCYLADDHHAEAEHYAKMLLNESPYYTVSPQDPMRFAEMVEQIKKGRTATITTASSQSESLNEVPVPTTLITAEMIKNCGGSNLQEVLAAYVPGMHVVDCNDDINIGMRGIYSNGQEKILIMLNGHRLNSYATNIAAPDYSISLEKIKQIEVLRGPASSLYGGVALTAVVNIITWQGADIDGVKVKAGVGNYGQLCGEAMIGKRYFDVDFLLWGSIYKASGEKRYVDKSETGLGFDGGDVTIGGIGKKPSYDVGLSLKYKDLQFFYNSAFSQIQAPMTMFYFYTPYNIEKYRTFNGIHPSFATQSHHATLSYQHTFGNVWLKGNVTYDNSDLTHYQVITDEPAEAIISLLPLPETLAALLADKSGLYRYINGQEHTIGAKLQGDWSYVNKGSHKGLLTFGAEYCYFNLNDVRYTFGYNFGTTIPETDTISNIGKGHETNFNTFLQLKHQWKDFIINAGIRLDNKTRYDNSRFNELSPRVALIYTRPKWNAKLSYSKSYIDAPYLYRKTNEVLISYLGEKDTPSAIDPETLHSWQLSFSGQEWVRGLSFEINGFYNRAHDLIYLLSADHVNAGNMDAYGIELSGNYHTSRFSADVNATWQDSKKNDIFSFNIDRLTNTPSLTINTILNWKASKRLSLHTHLQYYSSQKSFHLDPINYSTYMESLAYYLELLEMEEANPGSVDKEWMEEIFAKVEYYEPRSTVEKDYSSRFIVNVGANYTIGPVELSFNIHNLFNHKYRQSGMTTGLIPQKGLWCLGTVSYKF